MKAYEISLFVVILSATIGFVNGIGVFGYQYEMTPQNDYVEWNVSQIGENFGNTSQISFFSKLTATTDMVIQGFSILIDMLFAIVCLYPTLVGVFHVPAQLSALLQVGIYAIYAIGILQFISGRSFKNIE